MNVIHVHFSFGEVRRWDPEVSTSAGSNRLSPDGVGPLIVINMHGSGLEARFEVALHQSICDELVVREIAISLAGHGSSDMKPGRTVLDWANEDLLAVLQSVDHPRSGDEVAEGWRPELAKRRPRNPVVRSE